VAAIGGLYNVPLQGYFFTYLGEFVRTKLQFVGGSVPSPHCAAATIMWAMAFRYHRPTFYWLAPIMISLYISTFYGRYHYVTDAVTGIAVAVLALLLAPALVKIWNRFAGRSSCVNASQRNPIGPHNVQSPFSKMR
jgi:membrane-associated phospholipid phosphatase